MSVERCYRAAATAWRGRTTFSVALPGRAALAAIARLAGLYGRTTAFADVTSPAAPTAFVVSGAAARMLAATGFLAVNARR